MSDNLKKEIDELFELILSINSKEDLEIFFEDLCTYKEIDSMAQRLQSAKLLMGGATYEEIIRKTDISSATLSRVSRCVKYGKGYKKILKKEEK